MDYDENIKVEAPEGKMAVRATEPGFYEGDLKEKGEEFFVPVGFQGKWFTPTDPKLAALKRQQDFEIAERVRKAREAVLQAQIDGPKKTDAAVKAAQENLKNIKLEAVELAKREIAPVEVKEGKEPTAEELAAEIAGAGGKPEMPNDASTANTGGSFSDLA